VAASAALLAAGGFLLASLVTGDDEAPSGGDAKAPVGARAPAPAAAPERAAEPPAQSVAFAAPSAAEATRVVVQFYEDVASGDWDSAWARQSEHYRRAKLKDLAAEGDSSGSLDVAPSTWPRGYVNVSDHLDASDARVTVKSVDERTRVATVDVTRTRWSAAGGSDCYVGQTWLLNEGGEWRYDPGTIGWPQRERRHPDAGSAGSGLLGDACLG
jgi:hypothetical protein